MARYTRGEMAHGRREARLRGLPVPKGVHVVETNSGRLIYVDKTGKAFPQKIADSLNRAARNRPTADVQDEARWIEYQQTGVPLTPADVRQIDSARARRGVRRIIDAINSGGVPPDIEREYIQAARRLAGLGATTYREPIVWIDRRKTFRWQPLARPKPRVIKNEWTPKDLEAYQTAIGQDWSGGVQQRLRDWMGMLGLRSPLPDSPARLAARLFQTFLNRPLAYVPWELAVLCANVVEPYYISQPRYDDYPLHVEHAVVSDKNCAYGAILRTLPDLSHWRGRWRRVTAYAGPWGIYQTESGPQAGCMIEPKGHVVEYGWAWDDSCSGDLRKYRNIDLRVPRGEYVSCFSLFVDWCYAAHGPFPRLMRRLPVYFVGKCAEAEEPDKGVMKAGGHYYPPIWVWVTQQLKLDMERIAKATDAHMAYIDAIHTRGDLYSSPPKMEKPPRTLTLVHSGDALNSHRVEATSRMGGCGRFEIKRICPASTFYGPAIGQWKVQHEGPAVYWGLNHYAVDCRVHGRICYKHQGIEEL